MPASNPESDGQARSSRLSVLWPASRREELIGILRALAVLGAMLTLSGLLARRMIGPGLPR